MYKQQERAINSKKRQLFAYYKLQERTFFSLFRIYFVVCLLQTEKTMRNRKKGQSCLFIISGKKGQLTARMGKVICLLQKTRKVDFLIILNLFLCLFIINREKPRQTERRWGICLLWKARKDEKRKERTKLFVYYKQEKLRQTARRWCICLL